MSAELIIRGRCLTQDPAQPRAEALAVRDGRIVAVGAADDVDALRGAGTEVIDAGGATVLPGFVEAHMHLFPGAVSRHRLDLTGVEGIGELTDSLRRYAAERPGEALLIAHQASYTLMGRSLTRQDLDPILPDRPCLLIAPDYHTGWANTAALERAGLLQGRTLPPGNQIVMEGSTATGELREKEAIAPVMRLDPGGGRERLGLEGTEPEGLTPEARAGDRRLLEEGLAYAASLGITTIHNMDGNLYQLELLEEIERDGGLLCRTEVPFHLTPEKPLESLDQASEMARRWGSETLWSGRVKIFADGVIDSGTAVMLNDYPDRPGWRGEPLFSQAQFDAAAAEADRRGLQISVHAIGDGAVRMVLDGYERAAAANGARDARHRIEHIELIDPADIRRFARLGVVASMQPPHAPGTMGLPLEPTLTKIGRQRWADAFAWRRLKDAGARIAFATDWPVSPLSPLASIQTALTRPLWADDLPDQRLSLAETLAAYTAAGAHACFHEDRLGRLAPGCHADIVILSGDIEATPPEQVAGLGIARTIMAGRTTHAA